jgi:hypothetical protein
LQSRSGIDDLTADDYGVDHRYPIGFRLRHARTPPSGQFRLDS